MQRTNHKITTRTRPEGGGAAAQIRLLLVLMAILPIMGCKTLGRSPARLPDMSELSRASAQLVVGMEAVHQHTRRALTSAFDEPLPCPLADVAPPTDAGTEGADSNGARSTGAGASEPVTPAQCFSRIFRPRIEAAQALATYASVLAEIARGGHEDRSNATALTGAISDLLKSLGLSSLPPGVQRAANAASHLWQNARDTGTAVTMASAVASADPHVQAVLDALIDDLDTARELILIVRKKLILKLILAHNHDLALRHILEAQRQTLSASLDGAATNDAIDTSAPPKSSGQSSDAAVAKLAEIQLALDRLPRREDLVPHEIDGALAVIDSGRAALAEWQRAHHRLGAALAAGRQPDFELVAAAAAVIHDTTQALTAPH